MASISVTHTFANTTTADATQVNTNFTDIINGTSDGSKDFSISALTCAGNFTANGTTNTLGSASNDDLVINASLASTVPIKTTFTYDIGSSSIGLRGLYLGDAGSAARATQIRSATIASGYTLTLPVAGGTSSYRMTTRGSGTTYWQAPSPTLADNYSISCSVGSSALTVALKGADGNDPSATNPVDISFRSATAATGTSSIVSATAATSVVVNSTATLGLTSGTTAYIFVYALNNGGTIELAVSSIWRDETSIGTTVSIDTSSDSSGFYSTTGRTDKAFRLIARLKYTTAPNGTYSATPDEIALNTCGALALKPIEYVAATSSEFSGATGGYASGEYAQMTGNSVVLQPGSYILTGVVTFLNSGTTPDYTSMTVTWATVNGDNTSSIPTAPTLDASSETSTFIPSSGIATIRLTAPTVRITVSTTTTIYLVARAAATTIANARYTAYLYAERIK